MSTTLTTEAMQEIYDAAVHSEATGDDQDAHFELLCKLEDVGGTGATIRKLIDMVRAANREAVPVGYTSAAALDLLSHGQAALIHKDAETTTFIEEEYRDIVPLFTCAQAIASGENCWSCGRFFTYVQHSECDGYCPHCNSPVDLDEEVLNDEA